MSQERQEGRSEGIREDRQSAFRPNFIGVQCFSAFFLCSRMPYIFEHFFRIIFDIPRKQHEKHSD